MSFKNSNFGSGNSDNHLYVDPADEARVVVPVADDNGNDSRNVTADHIKLIGELQKKLDSIKAMVANNPMLAKGVDMAGLNIDPSTVKPSQIAAMIHSVSAVEQQVASASASEDVDVVSTTTAAIGALGKLFVAKQVVNAHDDKTDPQLLALLAHDGKAEKSDKNHNIGPLGVEGGAHHSLADLGALQPTVISGELAKQIAATKNSGANITV